MNHSQIKDILLRNNDVKKEYDDLKPIYEIQKEIILLRTQKGFSQKDLADRVGTKQSAISRLENGTYNPSILFLNKLARALDKECHISFK
ncbi:MAG: transcriptional regulator [Alkaliphilus sp.]|jgi:predicted transcriptional regulator|nr:helix-turn-helix transcriptional regulator [bacterium AH-315-L21]PHS30759.1 MAG: transcriptional regulator [Alkaliphilus sp.]